MKVNGNDVFLSLMTYALCSLLGNMLPVNQFGLVDTEDNHEYLPFMVCYYQDENQLNTAASAELVRRRRDTATGSRRKPNRAVVVDEE